MWNVRTYDFDEKEKITSKRTYEDESTDAKSRDGTVCSSEETSVMEVEPRSCIIQFCSLVNQKTGRN